MAKDFVVRQLSIVNYANNELKAPLDSLVGTLSLYGNTKPNDPDDTAGAAPLLDIPLPAPCFGSASFIAGTPNIARLTANAISPATVTGAGGTAVWYRVTDNAGTALYDGTVGTTAGQFDLVLSDNVLNTNDQVSISSWVIDVPDRQ